MPNYPSSKILAKFDLGRDAANVKKCSETIKEISDAFRKKHKGKNPDAELVLSFPPYKGDRFDYRAPCELMVRYQSIDSKDFDWILDYCKENKITKE